MKTLLSGGSGHARTRASAHARICVRVINDGILRVKNADDANLIII